MHVLRPWHLSIIFHGILALLVFFLAYFKTMPIEIYEIPVVYSAPKDIQNLNKITNNPKVTLKSVNKTLPEIKTSREVFGASRDSYTDNSVGIEGVSAKKGNTLAKEADTVVLLDTDSTTLPNPVDEYLVSEMPVALSEFRPIYPKMAKEKRIEGSVVMDVLIDETGKVRQVSVIEGLEIFKSSAQDAMKKFLFRPAVVDGSPVAVRIRYSIKFKLEM